MSTNKPEGYAPDLFSEREKARLVREYQRQTTGTEQWHRHPLGLTYTDGIAFLADTCGAYWLIDLVASHQPEIRKKREELAEFQVWRLSRDLRPDDTIGWLVEAWTDTPGEKGSKLLARQEIEYSDFPPELAPFEWYVESRVMLLKEEH